MATSSPALANLLAGAGTQKSEAGHEERAGTTDTPATDIPGRGSSSGIGDWAEGPTAHVSSTYPPPACTGALVTGVASSTGRRLATSYHGTSSHVPRSVGAWALEVRVRRARAKGCLDRASPPRFAAYEGEQGGQTRRRRWLAQRPPVLY